MISLKVFEMVDLTFPILVFVENWLEMLLENLIDHKDFFDTSLGFSEFEQVGTGFISDKTYGPFDMVT